MPETIYVNPIYLAIAAIIALFITLGIMKRILRATMTVFALLAVSCLSILLISEDPGEQLERVRGFLAAVYDRAVMAGETIDQVGALARDSSAELQLDEALEHIEEIPVEQILDKVIDEHRELLKDVGVELQQGADLFDFSK